MNLLHRWYCSSGHWTRIVDGKLLPWVLSGVDLGENVRASPRTC